MAIGSLGEGVVHSVLSPLQHMHGEERVRTSVDSLVCKDTFEICGVHILTVHGSCIPYLNSEMSQGEEDPSHGHQRVGTFNPVRETQRVYIRTKFCEKHGLTFLKKMLS